MFSFKSSSASEIWPSAVRQLFEQTLTGVSHRNAARGSVQTPRRASSRRIEWLSADGVTSSRDVSKAPLIGNSEECGQIGQNDAHNR